MAQNITGFQAVFLCYFSAAPMFSHLARRVFFTLAAVLLMILSLWNVTLCQ